MSDAGDRRASKDEGSISADPMDDRLGDVAEALAAWEMTVWRRRAYRDCDGDGTGGMGWLWLRTAQRLSPGSDYDIQLQYSAADREWRASIPGRRAARIMDIGEDDGHAALAAAVAAFAAGQGGTGDYGATSPGEESEAPVIRREASRLPRPETLRSLEWAALILNDVTVAVVLPFVQALAQRPVPDLYEMIKRRVKEHREPTNGESPHAVTAAGYVQIDDPDTGLRMICPEPIPPEAMQKLPEAVQELLAVDTSTLKDQILIWDHAQTRWVLCRRH